MLQSFWNTLKLSPAILGAILLLSCHTSAQTVSAGKLILDRTPSATILSGSSNESIEVINQNTALLEQINQYSQAPTNAIEQVTSVSQLSDVQPTDWAYTVLQPLVERYGCIAGYLDGSFRGNRALTRYEFAAGLNACLDRVNELIATATANGVAKEDLVATLQRLQAEFAAELAALRGRVDTLEAVTANLEEQQFSTTTKLSGLLIFAVNGGTIKGETEDRPDPNVTALSYLLLNFQTSFTGSDQLLTQLFAGSGGAVDEATKVTPAILSFLDYSGVGNDVALRRLRYTFGLSEDLRASIFLRGNATDFVDFNRYANDSAADFSTSSFLFNLLLVAGDATGSGVALTWKPNSGPLTLKALYRVDAAADPNPRTTNVFFSDPNRAGRDRRGGLFGDPNLAVFEAEFVPSDTFALRVGYSLGSQGGAGYSAIGVNAEFAPFKSLALFGRFAHAFDYTDVIGAGVADNSAKPASWMAGVSFPNLFGEGTLAGFAIGQPFIEDSVGDVTQLNMEAFYRFPINENLTITPLVQVINNPGNSSSNGTLYTGTLRMSFSF
jgi:porin